eukprot:Nk52_evm1s1296 gene=Nk52_evmTU1s1296
MSAKGKEKQCESEGSGQGGTSGQEEILAVLLGMDKRLKEMEATIGTVEATNAAMHSSQIQMNGRLGALEEGWQTW